MTIIFKSTLTKFNLKMIYILFIMSAFNLAGAVPMDAKSACGEVSCYGCCIDNCKRIVLQKKDIGSKELAKAIKACESGCSSIHWTGASLSGRLLDNAEEKLNKYCSKNATDYNSYCQNAINLWGKDCDSHGKTENTQKPDIDQQFNQFETSVKEDIAKNLIKKAFPNLTDMTIIALLKNNNITKGINFRTLTTPFRMAQGLQQIINRISRVKEIIPVNKLDTFEEISSTLESEIRNISPEKTPAANPSESSYLGRYQGLDNDALFSALNKDLQDVMAMLSKPDVNGKELKAAIKKLLRIYDTLEKSTDDPDLKQMIGQVKSTFQQLLTTM